MIKLSTYLSLGFFDRDNAWTERMKKDFYFDFLEESNPDFFAQAEAFGLYVNRVDCEVNRAYYVDLCDSCMDLPEVEIDAMAEQACAFINESIRIDKHRAALYEGMSKNDIVNLLKSFGWYCVRKNALPDEASKLIVKMESELSSIEARHSDYAFQLSLE